MNKKNLEIIFSRYAERFDELNVIHEESYKWRIAGQFKAMMKDTLSGPLDEFADRLYELKTLTSNMIDSYTQPFNGLCQFAGKYGEAETVRQMFRDLYDNDGGDVNEKEKKIHVFLNRSHALRDKYTPGSFRYNDDFHSVTAYLFLYDPNHNYLYKSSDAHQFADHVEFFDEWGSGESVKLDVYYRMCDQLVEAMKENTGLMDADAGRFQGKYGLVPEELHPDSEKHILAFDLIYCSSKYGLFSGIPHVKLTSKEKNEIQKKMETAKKLKAEFDSVAVEYNALEEAMTFLEGVYAVGNTVIHKKYGEGTVISCNGNTIAIDFSDGKVKKVGVMESIMLGNLSCSVNEYDARISKYKGVLQRKSVIESAYKQIGNEIAPYLEYLE